MCFWSWALGAPVALPSASPRMLCNVILTNDNNLQKDKSNHFKKCVKSVHLIIHFLYRIFYDLTTITVKSSLTMYSFLTGQELFHKAAYLGTTPLGLFTTRNHSTLDILLPLNTQHQHSIHLKWESRMTGSPFWERYIWHFSSEEWEKNWVGGVYKLTSNVKTN